MQIIKFSNDCLVANVDENVVLLNRVTGKFIELNSIGREVFDLIKNEGSSIETINDHFIDMYAGEPDIIRGDISAFLDKAIELGIFKALDQND